MFSLFNSAANRFWGNLIICTPCRLSKNLIVLNLKGRGRLSPHQLSKIPPQCPMHQTNLAPRPLRVGGCFKSYYTDEFILLIGLPISPGASSDQLSYSTAITRPDSEGSTMTKQKAKRRSKTTPSADQRQTDIELANRLSSIIDETNTRLTPICGLIRKVRLPHTSGRC